MLDRGASKAPASRPRLTPVIRVRQEPSRGERERGSGRSRRFQAKKPEGRRAGARRSRKARTACASGSGAMRRLPSVIARRGCCKGAGADRGPRPGSTSPARPILPGSPILALWLTSPACEAASNIGFQRSARRQPVASFPEVRSERQKEDDRRPCRAGSMTRPGGVSDAALQITSSSAVTKWRKGGAKPLKGLTRVNLCAGAWRQRRKADSAGS